MDTVLLEPAAPVFVRRPVDALQAADSVGFILLKKKLTKNRMRVDSQLFFDISKVFPVGGEYRDPSKITAHGQAKTSAAGNGDSRTKLKLEAARGSVRVYSELLVEENMKSLKAKIEAPRC